MTGTFIFHGPLVKSSPEWDEINNPLLVTTEDVRVSHPYMFRFEMAWFTHEEFQEKLLAKWPDRGNEEIQDYWKKIKNT
jgi:hypothetical protein